MAIVTVPTRTDLSVYDFTLALDDVVFTVSMVFNTRANRWFFSLADIDGNALRQGLKLVSNWPLTVQWTQQGRPEGELICANPETDDDADRDTLGTSAVFVYDEGGAFG